MKDIGRKIKLRRVELEMTQADLANACNITQTTIVSCEKGKLISMATLMKICDALKLKLSIEKMD